MIGVSFRKDCVKLDQSVSALFRYSTQKEYDKSMMFRSLCVRQESIEISLPRDQAGAWIGRITFLDTFTLREFCGSGNRNLKILQKNTCVQLKQNADKVVLIGEEQDTTKQALAIMIQLLDLLEQGKGLHPAEVDQFSRMLIREPDVDLSELYRDTVFVGDRKKRIYPRSLRQRHYCKAITNNDLVFGVGQQALEDIFGDGHIECAVRRGQAHYSMSSCSGGW